jgi:hypothetical protein
MKLGEKRGEGSTSVTEGELGLEIDFGHGAIELGQIEEGIVTKAAGASGGVEDHAFDGAIGRVSGLAVTRGDEDAMISGGTFCRWNSVEPLEKEDVIPDIGVVVGIGRVDESGVSGETGGADSGRAREGIDFEARVVGEDSGAWCELGIVDSFESGIFGECFAVFFGRLNICEIRERIDGDGVGFGGRAEVAQFALAGGGYE